MSDLVDYLRDKLADAERCTCPDCDVSTPDRPYDTIKGWSRNCAVHGMNPVTQPVQLAGSHTVDYKTDTTWWCRTCGETGRMLAGVAAHLDKYKPRKRWWRR